MRIPIKNTIALAPMAGVTDPAFRSLCAEFGADMTVTELKSDRAILFSSQSDQDMYKTDFENIFGIQLFGNNPVTMARSAKKIEDNCDFIDINMGCPSPKIMRTQAGSALLKSPLQARAIVREVKKAVSIPVSVKLRTGITTPDWNFKTAISCQEGGADWITIHGRTTTMGYSGSADWTYNKKLAQQLDIPVIGNGDIRSSHQAISHLSRDISGIAVGRHAMGNPWIFSQIKQAIHNKTITSPSFSNRFEVFFKYLKRAKEHNTSLLYQKLQAQHFFKGISHSARFRKEISLVKSSRELKETTNSFRKRIEDKNR
ncbi:MAG: tRNA dihydrouridine synthase [Nanobdellota archaeon]